jgi:hypothetical protein
MYGVSGVMSGSIPWDLIMGGVGSDSKAYAMVLDSGGLSEYGPGGGIFTFMVLTSAEFLYPGTRLSSAFSCICFGSRLWAEVGVQGSPFDCTAVSWPGLAS